MEEISIICGCGPFPQNAPVLVQRNHTQSGYGSRIEALQRCDLVDCLSSRLR